MFGKKTGSSGLKMGNIDCLIGARTRIEGDTDFEGGLRMDGRITGNLRGGPNSLLILSEQAELEGELHCSNAIINGRVIGAVHVNERLELQPKSRITGDVHYSTLEMHPGAVVEGRLVHQNQPVADPVINLDLGEASALRRARQQA